MPSPTPIVWTDIDLVAEARELLSDGGTKLESQPEGSLAGINDAAAIIAGSLIRGNAALFDQTPGLLVIVRSGIGYERIDLEAASAAGVFAANTPDAPTESTAEFTIALMLAVSRRLCTGAVELAYGRWSNATNVTGIDLADKTLGLVGCGRIGSRVANIARALGMQVKVFDPLAAALPTEVIRVPDLATLLATSDVISLHVPSTQATWHIIDASALAVMKPGAILINTARGSLIDADALHAALQSNRLSGVGLDVWDPEPPSADLPLLRHPRVIATPHMAALTREGRIRSHLAAATQVMQVIRGESPRFLLNPAVCSRRRSSPWAKV